MSLSKAVPMEVQSFSFRSAGRTDVGLVRRQNEDSLLMNDTGHFWAVADGMGGHASGQVASALAIEHIEDFLTRWCHEPMEKWPFDLDTNLTTGEAAIWSAIQVANLRIYNRSQVDETCEGMGTTVVLIHFDADSGLCIGHAGDSRCYRIRGGMIEKLTEDHSLAGQLTRSKLLTEYEARQHAGANVVLRALGIEDRIPVETNYFNVQLHDTYLLCSDGLTDQLRDFEIEDIVNEFGSDLDSAVEALVDQANINGGHDNITAVVVRVEAPIL